MMLQLQFNNRVALSSCNRPAYSDNAILFYVPYADDNKLQFSSKVECKVVEVYDRGAHYSREGR